MKIFIDIECVKTRLPGYRERIAATIKPPATMKKAETIAKWEDEEKEAAIEAEIEKTVFNGGLCHVVQIQYALGDADPVVLIAETIEEEKRVISDFLRAISDQYSSLTFVGHNIANFDIKILRQRCTVLGINMPSNFLRATRAKPWDEILFDTMIQWAGVGGYLSKRSTGGKTKEQYRFTVNVINPYVEASELKAADRKTFYRIELFEQILLFYPVQDGRKEAWQAFVKLDPDEKMFFAISADMQQRLDGSKPSVRNLHLANYFRRRLWELG